MIKILMVDDHLIVRDGIKKIIDDIYDMQIVDEASNGEEALQLIKIKTYDIILLDISMPGLNGLQTLKLINHLLYLNFRYIFKERNINNL